MSSLKRLLVGIVLPIGVGAGLIYVAARPSHSSSPKGSHHSSSGQRAPGLGLDPYQLSDETLKFLIEKASPYRDKPEIEAFIIFLKALLEARSRSHSSNPGHGNPDEKGDLVKHRERLIRIRNLKQDVRKTTEKLDQLFRKHNIKISLDHVTGRGEPIFNIDWGFYQDSPLLRKSVLELTKEIMDLALKIRRKE